MIGNPVMWNENNQILGYEINVYLNDSTIDKVLVKDNSLAIQYRGIKDQYNQLSGKEMTASFNNGELNKVVVEGNALSLYYLVEDDGTVIGLNKTESPYLSMDIEEEKLKRLKLWPTVTAITTPLPQLLPEQKLLDGFVWLDYLRPLNSSDIFRRNTREKGDIEEQPQRRFEREDVTL